jgi:SAM-dependent methyltransferase
VADEYARRIGPELLGKPFDRELLDRYAARVASLGAVWDLGCGPGHVTRYLRDRSVDVSGMDLSPELIRCARRLNPDIGFEQGDFRRLSAEDGAWAGIVAFYAILHLAPSEVAPTLAEWRRVLRPGGLLLLAVHIGTEELHLEEWWGRRVDITFRFFQPAELQATLVAAGFALEEVRERDPYPGVETQTRRVYLLARARGPGEAA